MALLMFPRLTKDDIAKLSDEQREVIARVALDQARTKRLLVERAEGYFGYQLYPVVLFVMACVLTIYYPEGFLSFAIFGLAALIQFHAFGINRRIDAILKLVNLRSEEQSRQQEAPAEATVGRQP